MYDAIEIAIHLSRSLSSWISELRSDLFAMGALTFTREEHLILAALVLVLLCSWVTLRTQRSGLVRPPNGWQPLSCPSGRERQIQTLNDRIQKLEALNRSYLHLITNISHVVKRINAKQEFKDIVFTFSHLIKNILQTDRVELFLYDEGTSVLKPVSQPDGQGNGNGSCYPLGKGLVGKAAQDGTVVRGEPASSKQRGTGPGSPRAGQLWAAAPILFERRLLGVIGIGRPEQTEGVNHLLRIIAEIAGVALQNQLYLSDAKVKAETDPLTGLYNRRYFYQISRKFVEKAITEQIPLSIFLLDIDHFKQYNDTNGHEEGDKLLVELSRLLQQHSRKDSVIARYGGEEFIVLLPGIPAEEAFRYAERIREAIASHPFAHRGKQPFGFVSISGGLATFPDHERSIQAVIRLADTALYQAKDAGRNRVLAYESSLFPEGTGQVPSFLQMSRAEQTLCGEPSLLAQ